MKTFAQVVAILAFLLIVLLVLARIALGLFVGSEAFRSMLNDELDRSVRAVLPTLMTELQSAELSGLASLQLNDVKIINTRRAEGVLLLPRTRLTPVWATLFFSPLWQFAAETIVAGDGRVSMTAQAPRSLLLASDSDTLGGVRVSGTLAGIDAVKLQGLLLGAQEPQGFSLNHGLLSGTFTFTKALGKAASAEQRNARLSGNLDDSHWTLTDTPGRDLKMPKIMIQLELIDDSLLLRTPLTLAGHSGKAIITGGMQLPHQSTDAAGWNLIVHVDHDEGLTNALSKLFRCTPPLTASHFTVKGLVGQPVCTQ